MRFNTFGEFVDKKKRESIKQLTIIKQMLEQQGLKVENHLESEDGDDPYVFCFSPEKTGPFDGIRIYKVGTTLAFRVQKENKTHPYGAAYPLPIESMFQDFLSDDGMNEEKAGKKIIESVSREIRRFFEKSVEADRKVKHKEVTKDVADRSTGTDYSALVYSKGS